MLNKIQIETIKDILNNNTSHTNEATLTFKPFEFIIKMKLSKRYKVFTTNVNYESKDYGLSQDMNPDIESLITMGVSVAGAILKVLGALTTSPRSFTIEIE